MSHASSNDTEIQWWQKAIIYELYVDKFAGTFEGLTKRLPYLADLGVTALHVLPHYPSPMVDDGYDVSDYRGVRPELGTLDDFVRFTEAAHARGIRVITDLVLNHVSVEHPWFQEAQSSITADKRGYFLWSDTARELAACANAFPNTKTSNWVRNEPADDFYFATFYPSQADLNWDNPAVREEIKAVMDFWIERGVDGFRLDAVPFLVKREGAGSMDLPETHAVLRGLRAHVRARSPDIVLLAEAHRPRHIAREYFGAGDECQLVYDFPLREALYALMAGAPQDVLTEAFAERDTPSGCAWATFLSNHDNVHIETLAPDVREQTLRFIDPRGEHFFGPGTSVRLGSLFAGDTDALIGALTRLLDVPGTPVLYYGDELGMQNAPLAPHERDQRRIMRGAFDWNEAARQAGDPSSTLVRTRALLLKRGARQ